MANRLRQTVQSIEGTPAEQRMDAGGLSPDLARALVPAAEMLPGSGFVTGVKKGGSEGGLDVLAELIGLAGGAIGTVAGPAGTIGGYALGKGGVKAVAKQGAKKSSILNKMEECVENIGGYANCKLAAQLTSDTADFSKLKTINISEKDKIVTEFFDSGTINNLTKNLEKGDILNFNERHYSVYSGNGKVVQVPEWGGKAEEVPLIGVLKEYNPPTNIYKAEKIKAKKNQGGSVVERNPYANYQSKAI
jgi:hypothetical protein